MHPSRAKYLKALMDANKSWWRRRWVGATIYAVGYPLAIGFIALIGSIGLMLHVPSLFIGTFTFLLLFAVVPIFSLKPLDLWDKKRTLADQRDNGLKVVDKEIGRAHEKLAQLTALRESLLEDEQRQAAVSGAPPYRVDIGALPQTRIVEDTHGEAEEGQAEDLRLVMQRIVR